MWSSPRIIVVLLIGCGLCTGLSLCIKNLKVVSPKSESPDKRFTVVIYSYRRIISEGGHGSGLVCLYDQWNGVELERRGVEDVGAIDGIIWSPTNVFIRPVDVWSLPPGKNLL
jgi:hypothetical protein